MRKFLALGVLGAISIGVVWVSNADFARPADAIAYRQSIMVVIGHHFTRIAAVVKGETPFDQKDMSNHADIVASLSKLPWDAFLEPGTVEKTQMKEAALQNKDAFRAAAGEMERETGKLAQVAASGNLNEIRSQFGVAAITCKACHDRFRAR